MRGMHPDCNDPSAELVQSAGTPSAVTRALLIADTDPQLGLPLAEFVDTHRIDMLITAGDLRPALLRGAEKLSIPKLGVYGNHCNGRYLEELGFINLHGLRVEVNGISFTGMQGCIRYKPDADEFLYTQGQYGDMVAQLPPADVLVTHCPPDGVNDHPDDPSHVGIVALRQWVDRCKPSVMIHGHTYPAQPVAWYGPTRVVYVYGGLILTLASRGEARANVGSTTSEN